MTTRMNPSRSIIITSLLGLLLACAAQVFAHGGFDHVTGTVVKLENNVLTVKTAKGTDTVTLDAKTEITRNDHPAQAADLKAGVRVVVDVPEGSKTKVAHSIKVGAAPVAAAHDAHK
ncbi:MAG TPA: hypothetical protein VGJ09_08175 [Bryobacteraceae bacterium]